MYLLRGPSNVQCYMLHELQMYQSEILEDRHNKFFDGRKRKVQVQFNVRFKRSPEGTLWLGSELPEQPPSKSKLKLRGVNNMASWFAKLLGKDKCHFAVLTEGTQQKPHFVANFLTPVCLCLCLPQQQPQLTRNRPG